MEFSVAIQQFSWFLGQAKITTLNLYQSEWELNGSSTSITTIKQLIQTFFIDFDYPITVESIDEFETLISYFFNDKDI